MGRSNTMDSYDDNDFDDVNESKKQIERNRNRREQRRLKNALRSKDIDHEGHINHVLPA